MRSILIADDHPIVLMGVKYFLEQKKYMICGICKNGIEAYNQILAKQPALALLDIDMPGMTGIEIVEKLNEQKYNRTKVVLLAEQNDHSTVTYAKRLNVKGFTLKGFAVDDIEMCLSVVLNGGIHFVGSLNDDISYVFGQKRKMLEILTYSERKILALVSEQKSTKEIADQLFISEKTVETHRSNIIRKLNIPRGKNALLKWAISSK